MILVVADMIHRSFKNARRKVLGIGHIPGTIVDIFINALDIPFIQQPKRFSVSFGTLNQRRFVLGIYRLCAHFGQSCVFSPVWPAELNAIGEQYIRTTTQPK